jgi:flagellin-specific chaperone FliS
MSKEITEKKNPKVLQNAFKEIKKDDNFVVEILKDVTGINLSEQEITKLKVVLRYETKGTLFDSIGDIYALMAANFKSPEKVIIVPFIDGKNMEHLNIQRIGY